MTKKNNKKMKEKLECRHKWVPLLAKVGKKNVPTTLFTCLKCGDLKVGKHTIRISKNRLDMGGKPIKSIGNPGATSGGARNIWVQATEPEAAGKVEGDIWMKTVA